MLRKLASAQLRAGLHLPGAICDGNGRILLAAGVRLTETHIERLARQGGVYTGDDWPDDSAHNGTATSPASEDGKVIEVNQLSTGQCLAQNIFDESDVLLLTAGTIVTARVLRLLKRRKITTVKLMSEPDEPSVDEELLKQGRQLDKSFAAEPPKDVPVHVLSQIHRPRLPLNELRTIAESGLQKHVAAREIVIETCERIESGEGPGAHQIYDTADAFVQMLSLDSSLVPLIVSMQESGNEYLFDHCVNTGLLSISIGESLGWNHEQLLEIGVSAFLHDIGMLRVPKEIRLAQRPLTRAERMEIDCHPYYTLGYLERMENVSQTAKFIAYQSHERVDRSGYPKGRSGMYLHPAAKIVAIADAYAAMTRPRPYRAALSPYQAAKTILVEGSLNKFDQRFVRAFLDAVSLFPIGSFVELSDGTKARVVRANPGFHTHPVVEELDTEARSTGRIIDLSEETKLSVIRALPALTNHERHELIIP